ncbi:hypothetical protein PIB30_061103 [Stylosanthes scabra]|uniref:Uncharacterized protein n=1 Tax=Stylosanthes scabra TaxID=79078 RepID=A0ABU6WLX4_9FABA|nr:hypothetical protein [Stylosanthes scabra]
MGLIQQWIKVKCDEHAFEIYIRKIGGEVLSLQVHPDECVQDTSMENVPSSSSVAFMVDETQKSVEVEKANHGEDVGDPIGITFDEVRFGAHVHERLKSGAEGAVTEKVQNEIGDNHSKPKECEDDKVEEGEKPVDVIADHYKKCIRYRWNYWRILGRTLPADFGGDLPADL